MTRILSRKATLGLATALSLALAAESGQAQNSWAVESLIRGSQKVAPLRRVEIGTRTTKRYAIVIGNSDYADIPDLRNAGADARLMADFLQDQGYIVNLHLDITKRGFEDVLRRALFDVDENTEVVVFFAGHGFQIGSENYLVPVDADLDSVYDVPFEAVSLGSLVGIIGSRAQLQIVILDSCRDNPFAGKTALTRVGNELRETRTGFSSQAAPLNSSLIFSTSPGSVAYDGTGDNSPFTEALVIEATERPDAPITEVFERVRRSVYETTQGRQVPWDSSTLVEPAHFSPTEAALRPVPVGADGGVTRGLAIISPLLPDQVEAGDATGPQTLTIVETAALLEAPFAEEVQIGATLTEALGLGAAETVSFTRAPDSGRLVLEDENGFYQSVVGRTLTGADVDRLILQTHSLQMPAVSLVNGVIADSMNIARDGVERSVALRLKPNRCDFHAGDHLDPDGMGLTRFANELEPEAAVVACRTAIHENPQVGRFHYQLGRALVALRRNDEARESFEKARDLGHARAWNALGNSILNEAKETGGEVNPKADRTVLELFARGVDAGDPYAMYSLGRQFMRFGGTDELEIEGYDLMMRSLEVGHTFAMNELGFFYLEEGGKYFDPERGLRYLRESAEREDIYGFNNMGLVYLDGLGGQDTDDARAYEMFTKAADGGHPTAPANLAFMYRDGRAPGGQNMGQAVERYLEALDRGDSLSGGTAAFLIVDQKVPGYDFFEAAIIAGKAAALVNQPEAERSRNLLARFPSSAVDGGSQRLINQLSGEERVTVDGAFGPASQSALEALLAERGVGPAATDPISRLIQLSAIVWADSPFRVDLY